MLILHLLIRSITGKLKEEKLIYFLASNADNKVVSDILEADAKQIATMACETFEKYVLFVFLYLNF